MSVRWKMRAGALLICSALLAASRASARDHAVTFYVGRISSVNAWHDLIKEPSHADFVDAYVAVAALSQEFGRFYDGRVSFEGEAQIGYNFGDQSHWETNVAMGPRWHTFPWSDAVATSVAFGLGLSLAGEVPEVEIELEGESKELLVYWSMELTLGPPSSNWAVSLRLHHRSGAFGLLADDGGMNAVALGARIAF